MVFLNGRILVSWTLFEVSLTKSDFTKSMKLNLQNENAEITFLTSIEALMHVVYVSP